MIGLPIWFVIGILITFSPEFGVAVGVAEPVAGRQSRYVCLCRIIAGRYEQRTFKPAAKKQA